MREEKKKKLCFVIVVTMNEEHLTLGTFLRALYLVVVFSSLPLLEGRCYDGLPVTWSHDQIEHVLFVWTRHVGECLFS